jgi:hypothetical protein
MEFTWLIRKLVFVVLMLGAYVFIDKKMFPEFGTGEAIKNDPKAIAIMFTGFLISLALV